jgi:hypothetical protein
MITRPMAHTPVVATNRGHSDAALTPLPHQTPQAPHAGYPHAVQRTTSFAFNPRFLPPVNKITGVRKSG